MKPPPDYEYESLRLPPQSVESEQAVLGALLLDNTAFDRIADVLGAEDFYTFAHRLIFQHIAKLVSLAKPADVVTVHDALKTAGKAEDAGGLSYLNEMAINTPSTANIRHYAKIVRDRSVQRRLIAASDEISGWAYNTKGSEVRTILDAAESRILSIAEEGSRDTSGNQDIKPRLVTFLEHIDELYHRSHKTDLIGISTGFIDLDKLTSGLQKGDLIIVAGRPSMGKTALSINIAEHVALTEQLPVLIFSMEMSVDQIISRMLGSVGRIDQKRLRTGQLLDDDWPRLTEALGKMEGAQIIINETPALNIDGLRSSARRAARQTGGLGLIVVDYLQLMSASSPGENRSTEIGEMSRGLKTLARELNCPVIAISQLNRSVETRLNKRPMMSDLRESGSIEQDADLIMFIYRDEVYNAESQFKGMADVIISKQRNGPIGDVTLTFNGPLTRFENFAGALNL